MILKNLESHSNTLIRENDIDFHIINSHIDLNVADLIQADAIIFRTDRVSLILAEIEKIRRSDIPALYLKPIFVTSQRVLLRLKDDIDGVVEASDLESIEETTKELILKIKEINPEAIDRNLPHSEKVLIKTIQFLFTRNKHLSPVRSRQALMGYEYPYVKNIIPNFEVTLFLDKALHAAQKNWLSKKLVDRVNLCRSCDSSYLHFSETCHKCGSIDIESESLIHHFRCAYIGPESDFNQEETLICPKCDKVLRHIGVDYDKPSEILQCNSCNHQSQQSAISAQCIDCGSTNEHSKLHSKEIYSLHLTSEGMDVARNPSGFSLEVDSRKQTLQEYEIEAQVFDLLRRQEIKKMQKNKLKSYSINIAFDNSILSHLVPSEVEVFTTEFRTIMVNYMEDVDLMTMRTPTEYDLLLSAKDASYVENMVATLQYNINKILNDNFHDPTHNLIITSAILDQSFVA